MVRKELVECAHRHLKKGHSHHDIKRKFMELGHDEKEVDEAIAHASKLHSEGYYRKFLGIILGLLALVIIIYWALAA